MIAQAFERLQMALRERHPPAFASFASFVDAHRMKKPLAQATA